MVRPDRERWHEKVEGDEPSGASCWAARDRPLGGVVEIRGIASGRGRPGPAS